MIVKKDLIDAAISSAGINRTESTKAVESVFDTIITALKSGEEIRINGFGIFSITERPERIGRNPRTGEAVTVAPLKKPKFKAGKTLLDAVQ